MKGVHLDDSLQDKLYLGGSILGIFLALLVWLLFAVVGHALFYLFDLLRGLGGDVLQSIFRELLMPGLGGYFGIAVVHDRMKKYNPAIVFYGFCSIIAILVFGGLAYVLPVAKPAGISTYDLVIHFLSGVTSLSGAYIAKKQTKN
jgi:hypothetical protein